MKEAEQQLDEIRNSFEAMQKNMGHKACCTLARARPQADCLNACRRSAGVSSQAGFTKPVLTLARLDGKLHRLHCLPYAYVCVAVSTVLCANDWCNCCWLQTHRTKLARRRLLLHSLSPHVCVCVIRCPTRVSII